MKNVLVEHRSIAANPLRDEPEVTLKRDPRQTDCEELRKRQMSDARDDSYRSAENTEYSKLS